MHIANVKNVFRVDTASKVISGCWHIGRSLFCELEMDIVSRRVLTSYSEFLLSYRIILVQADNSVKTLSKVLVEGKQYSPTGSLCNSEC